MILNQDWRLRCRGRQSKDLPRESQSVHVQHIRGQAADQRMECCAPSRRRSFMAERKKMIRNAIALQLFSMGTGLDDRDPHAWRGARGFGHIYQRTPGLQQFGRSALGSIAVETDLRHVQQAITSS